MRLTDIPSRGGISPAERKDTMTSREMYRECERLYQQVDWTDKESIHRYNEAVRRLRKQREEEQEEQK